MLDPVTTTNIGFSWSNINEECVDIENYLQLKDKDQNKWETLYIDVRPQTIGNIVGFINNTQRASTLKKPNCIFGGREGNHVFVCAIKSITIGEEFLINYNLNVVDTNTVTMDVVHPTIYPTFYYLF